MRATGLLTALLLACVLIVSASASADVNMTGALKKVSSSLRSSPGEVQPLATSASGDYECVDKYSVVANWYYYFALGNCKKGWRIEVVSKADENKETHETSYGGFVTGAFSGCGWIDSRYPLNKVNSEPNSACSEGAGGEFKIEESKFMEKHNSGTGDGYYVVNKVPCQEYANYRPWSSNNVEQEPLGEAVPAYATESPGNNTPRLKWRYVTKYASTDGSGKYVMVRDDHPGEANWVFVPRSCLPATLPENNNERVPSKPAVTTEPASGVATPSATLHGSVNPEGVATTYYFQYGRTTNWNESSTTHVEVGAGTTTLQESASISGLAAGVTYYYRIVASSAVGTSEGSAQSFAMQPPPSVVTEPALGIQQTQVTLEGSVTTNGLDTHYHFEYGTEAGHYTSSTPEADAGGGGKASATVTGLSPVKVYHYRLTASSSAGASYGGDVAVETLSMPKPSSVEINGTRHVYYRSLNGQLREWYWNGTGWTQRGWGSEGQVASNPSAVVHSNGSIDVYYRNAKGQLGQWWYGPNWSSEWTQANWGSENEVTGDPSAVALPNGSSDVYYRNAKGQLGQWWYGSNWSSEWTQANWGSEKEVAGDPSAAAHSNNNVYVYYRTVDGQLGQWWYGASWSSEWHEQNWGYNEAIGGDPAATVLDGGGDGVNYGGTNTEMWEWHINGSAWWDTDIGAW